MDAFDHRQGLNDRKDLDMSLHHAIRMMGTAVNISVESSLPLAAEIATRQVKDHPVSPHKAAITPAIGLESDFQMRPISAMLELARGTALHDDPGVAAFARNWSTLRYLGLFGRNALTGNLHLDAEALQYIGPNQRRVLSEELGIGFGIVAAKRWCRARSSGVGPISAIDVDRALHKRVVPGLKPKGDRQPDYLLAYSDPTNPGVMVFDLLETKGSVSRSTGKSQLSRAVTQLASLTVNKQAITGIAVSTVSNVDGVLIMAVDPEERPVTWRPTSEALERWRGPERRPWKEDVEQLDVPAEELFATATNVDYAALAEFSSQRVAATRWLPSLDPDRRGESNADVRRITEAGRFLGAEYVIDVPGTSARVRLYQGVEEHIVDGLNALDATAVAEAQRAFADANAADFETLSEGTAGIEVVSAVNSEGSILEISIV